MSLPQYQDRDLSLPPHSVQAEHAVLGSVLKNTDSINRVADFLRPSDFYQVRARLVFSAMLELAKEQHPIDYHTTADKLQQQGTYDRSGGLLYLSELDLATGEILRECACGIGHVTDYRRHYLPVK